MRIAAGAENLCAHHAEAAIIVCNHILGGDWLEEAGPSRT